MKAMEVSIDLISSERSLAELMTLSGCDASEGSFDRGDVHPDGRVHGESRLRITSDAEASAGIEEHLASLAGKIREDIRAEHGAKIILDVAIFSDTAMASVTIPVTAFENFPLTFTEIEISAYPCATE